MYRAMVASRSTNVSRCVHSTRGDSMTAPAARRKALGPVRWGERASTSARSTKALSAQVRLLDLGLVDQVLASALQHDPAVLEDVRSLGELERHAGVLLDEQDA